MSKKADESEKKPERRTGRMARQQPQAQGRSQAETVHYGRFIRRGMRA